jgi:hypothetical protein
MKKILLLFVVVSMISAIVSATDMDINPEIVDMATTETKVVEACVLRSNGNPFQGLVLNVEAICKDVNANGICDPYDVSNPATFSISAPNPTDSSGCTDVTLTTTLAEEGDYAYRLRASDMVVDVLVEVASESGNVTVIPEFGIVGALLTISAAGLFVIKRRG